MWFIGLALDRRLGSQAWSITAVREGEQVWSRGFGTDHAGQLDLDQAAGNPLWLAGYLGFRDRPQR
jgi:hypothetical protein